METILHGSVGLLTARSGGHLVSLQCYVSPYDIFEEGTGTQLNLSENSGKYMDDMAVHVKVEQHNLHQPYDSTFNFSVVVVFVTAVICLS